MKILKYVHLSLVDLTAKPLMNDILVEYKKTLNYAIVIIFCMFPG